MTVEQLFVYTRDREEISADDVATVLEANHMESETGPKIMIQGIIPLQEAVESLEKQLLARALSLYKTTTQTAKVLGVSQPTIVR